MERIVSCTNNMLASIIIPTYNRKEILLKTLQSIQRQQDIHLHDLEVIVVDDGSTDGTYDMLQQHQQDFSFHLKPLQQTNQGQGNARNLGMKYVSGHIVFFIGDDIELHTQFVREHIKVHTKYRDEAVVCLGFTTWHPSITVTPFMYFLEHGGHQFNYPKLEKQPIIDYELQLREGSYWYFYTSNISIKRSLLQHMVFEPVYTSYGWEDIEFGYRLYKEYGMRLLYTERAMGYHIHEVSEDSFQKRMVSVSKNALLFHKRYPEVPILPTGIKKVIFSFIASPFVIIPLCFLSKYRSCAQQWYYYALSKKYFLEGITHTK